MKDFRSLDISNVYIYTQRGNRGYILILLYLHVLRYETTRISWKIQPIHNNNNTADRTLFLKNAFEKKFPLPLKTKMSTLYKSSFLLIFVPKPNLNITIKYT